MPSKLDYEEIKIKENLQLPENYFKILIREDITYEYVDNNNYQPPYRLLTICSLLSKRCAYYCGEFGIAGDCRTCIFASAYLSQFPDKIKWMK